MNPASTFGSLEVVGTSCFFVSHWLWEEAIPFLTGKTELKKCTFCVRSENSSENFACSGNVYF